jgi:iron complex outermembrane receptor protein
MCLRSPIGAEFRHAATKALKVAACLLAGVCSAQEKTEGNASLLKSLSLEELSKIEITSVSKESNPVFRTAAAVYVLTREDIRRSGATTIPDLLRLVPGVEVAQIDSGKWAIGIRGFQGRLSKSVLVLIDGRSVYTPLFAGVYWEAQDTPIESIDRIEVIRGPGGTIWGANAVNGVINIITMSAQQTRGAQVTALGGNVEQGTVSAAYGAGSDQLSYRVFGKGFTRGPQFHPDGRNFDDWRRVLGGFRLDWNPNSRDSVNVIGNAYDSTVGTQLGISTFAPPRIVNTDGNAYLAGQNIVAGWRRALQGGGDLQVRGYFDRTSRDDLNYKEVRNTVDLDFILHKPIERHDLTWGAGLRISPSTFSQKVPTVDFLPHRQTYSIYSAFAQDNISIVPDRLTVAIGSKFEYNTFSGFEFQPSVRFAWTPSDRQTLWGAFTRAVRTPSRIEDGFKFSALIVPSLPLFVRLVGDGAFEPEKLMGYELGYRLKVFKTGFFSINSYYNRSDDLLSVESTGTAPESSPSPAHLVLPLLLRNGLQAQTAGVEFTSVWDLRSWWRLRGSYSFMHLDAKRKPGSIDLSTVGQLEGDSPRHSTVVQNFFTLSRSVEMTITYRYVSALPDQKVQSYSTGDVRLGKRLGRHFEIAVVGRNLLQPSHFEYGGDPSSLVGIRRSGHIQVTWLR